MEKLGITFEPIEKRISTEALHIRTAGLYSQRGTCGRLQVGAIAVRHGRPVANAYNGPLKSENHCNSLDCDTSKPCQRAVHAEANLIAYCAREGIALGGAELYVTHSPCIKCAELIIAAGISHVYFRDSFRDTSGLVRLHTNGIKITKIDEQGNPQQI